MILNFHPLSKFLPGFLSYYNPHSALQVYYKGIFKEEGGLQPLLLLITINSFCNIYFYL